MSEDVAPVRAPLETRVYLWGHTISGVVFAGMYFLLLGADAAAANRYVYLTGVVVWMLSSALAAGMQARTRDPSPQRMLLAVLPFDLLAIAAFTVSAGHAEDPFLPWVIGLSVVYAVRFPRERAWKYSAGFAAAYIVGHFGGRLVGIHLAVTAGVTAFVACKAALVIAIGWAVGERLSEMEERGERVAQQGMEIAELNVKLSRSVAELNAISEVTDLIHSTLDFDGVGPMVIDVLQKVMNMPACALMVVDKDKQETVFTASRGIGSRATTYDALTGRELLEGSFEVGGEHFACTTLADHRRLMVVFCADAEVTVAMTPDDRLMLQAVASELVVAVENSQLYKLTKRLAITDDLTDLYNYRYLQQRLSEEFERARRYTKDLSFLMIDVDDFKSYNDTYGHVAGDDVLADLASVLKTSVREVDVIARYGGEEFCVILPETDASGAFIVAEKVREAVSLYRFTDAEGSRGVHLTVSIGLASYPLHADSAEALLREADDAVYKSKRTGKDRVRAPQLDPARRVQQGAAEAELPEPTDQESEAL